MTHRAVDTIRIAEELARCAEALDTREQEMQLALFRLLAEGAPVKPARLAAKVGVATADASECLERWVGVHTDADGRVVAFGGLSIVPAPHRLRIDGRSLYAWCAWDTLFLPELIGSHSEVDSSCPITDQPISLGVGREGPSELSPPEAVLSFRRPGPAFADEVVDSFCRFVHFFASSEAAEAWIARSFGSFVISIDEGFEIGGLTNAARFAHALER